MQHKNIELLMKKSQYFIRETSEFIEMVNRITNEVVIRIRKEKTGTGRDRN